MRKIAVFAVAVIVLAVGLCPARAELNEIPVKIFAPEFLSNKVFFKAIAPTQDPLSKDPLTVKSLDFHFLLRGERMKISGIYDSGSWKANFFKKYNFKDISAVWVDVAYKECGTAGHGFADMIDGFSCKTDQTPRHRSYTIKQAILTDNQLVVKFLTNPVSGWDVVKDKSPQIKMIWLETSEWVGIHYNPSDVEKRKDNMVRCYAKWSDQEKLWVCQIRYTADSGSEFPAWHQPQIFTSVINKTKTVKEKWWQPVKLTKQ